MPADAERTYDKGFADLAHDVRAAGLLERRRGYYVAKIGLTVAAFAAGWYGLLLVGNSPWSLAVAAYLGLAFTQVVFLGHDAGHRQIFATKKANAVVGYVVGNLLAGMSFGWWLPKHNAHHAHPNEEDRDPDIGPGVVAFTAADVRSRSGFSRWAARHQAALFYPLLFLEAIGLHVSSVRSILQRGTRESRREALLLVAHVGLYLTAVLWILSPLRALEFIVIQQGLFGFYLGCSFAPNHIGMPIIDRGAPIPFARRQILTARNVRGGRLGTFLLGGLDYQIEHHLFPTMPRPNLRKVQSAVRAYCASNGLSYREESVLQSYFQVIRHLRAIGSDTSLDTAVVVPLDSLARALGETASNDYLGEGSELRHAEVQHQAGSRT